MNNIPAEKHSIPFWASVFTVFVCILFGANTVAIKLTLSGIGVFTSAALRFCMASTAIFLWAWITRQPFKIKGAQVYQLLILSIIFTVQLSMFYLGVSKTHASRAALIINIQPFFVLMLAHYFIPGDSITMRKILGMILGFTGVVFLFLNKKGLSGFVSGDFIMLITTGIWACNAIYTKRIIQNFQAFHIVFYPMIFSIPLFFLQGFLWDKPMIGHWDKQVIGSLLYQGLVSASFGFVAWNTLLQKYGAVALHSFLFIIPITGVVLGGLVLGEPITSNILISLIMIVSGILTVHLRRKISRPDLLENKSIPSIQRKSLGFFSLYRKL